MHLKLAATTLALALPLAAGAEPVTYEIDPDHTFPHFMVQHLGVSWMHGRFNKTSGKLVLDRAAKTGSVEVTIETASVDTGTHELRGRTRTRDEHLRTADFFNVQEFPTMTYKGSAKWSGEWPSEVQGQLTLLGVTRPVNLKVDGFGCAPDPRMKGKREGVRRQRERLVHALRLRHEVRDPGRERRDPAAGPVRGAPAALAEQEETHRREEQEETHPGFLPLPSFRGGGTGGNPPGFPPVTLLPLARKEHARNPHWITPPPRQRSSA